MQILVKCACSNYAKITKITLEESTIETIHTF